MKKLILAALLVSTPVLGQDTYSTMVNPVSNERVAAMIAAASLRGEQGQTGATGPQGPASTVPGPQGVAGERGPQGVAGSVGPQGPIGLTGPQGPQGVAGATGPQGPAPAINVVFLPNATFGETATLQLNAGYRRVTTTVAGCIAGDRVLLTPTAALGAGYSLADAYCLTANNLTINVYAPLLVVGGTYSVTAKVTVFR